MSNNIIGEGQTSPILCEGTYYAVTTDESTGCFIQDTINVEYDLPFGIVDISNTTAFSILIYGVLDLIRICGVMEKLIIKHFYALEIIG